MFTFDLICCYFFTITPANALHATNNFQIIPDFSLKDSMDQTVLGLALWTGRHHCIQLTFNYNLTYI